MTDPDTASITVAAVARQAIRDRYAGYEQDEIQNRLAFVAGDVQAALDAVRPLIEAEARVAERQRIAKWLRDGGFTVLADRPDGSGG